MLAAGDPVVLNDSLLAAAKLAATVIAGFVIGTVVIVLEPDAFELGLTAENCLRTWDSEEFAV